MYEQQANDERTPKVTDDTFNPEGDPLFERLNHLLEEAGRDPLTPAQFVRNIKAIFEEVLEEVEEEREIPEEFQSLMEASAANPILSFSLMECYPTPNSIKG